MLELHNKDKPGEMGQKAKTQYYLYHLRQITISN